MHVNLLGHVEVPEMYNADKVHEEKMPCGLENSWKAFKGDFFEVMKKKIVLIPFKVQLSIHLLSIHHAESSLQDHSKV